VSRQLPISQRFLFAGDQRHDRLQFGERQVRGQLQRPLRADQKRLRQQHAEVVGLPARIVEGNFHRGLQSGLAVDPQGQQATQRHLPKLGPESTGRARTERSRHDRKHELQLQRRYGFRPPKLHLRSGRYEKKLRRKSLTL